MWTLASEVEFDTNNQHNVVRYFEDGLTDESEGSSTDVGGDERTRDCRKLSSESEQSHRESGRGSAELKLQRLKDNVTRTTTFLSELKILSESCQEHIPAIQLQDEEDDELFKTREVFIRRIVQLGAELQDAKDTVLAICKDRMSIRQWRLLLDITGPNQRHNDDNDDDAFISGMMSSCNLDPSVRFFGIEWERVFGRCFSLSLNVKIFGQQILESMEENHCSSHNSTAVDIILVNTILKDLSTLEADVTSHAEAVLQGRLSKSQQRLVKQEQLKNCAPLSQAANGSSANCGEKRKKSSRFSNQKGTSLTKSKSFRRFCAPTPSPVAGRKQSQPIYKYRKNKTTNLDKLGSELEQLSIPVDSIIVRSREAIDNKAYETSFPKNGVIAQVNGCDNDLCTAEYNENNNYSQEMKRLNQRDVQLSKGMRNERDQSNEYILPKKKTSLLQNVSSMFKNIR